MPHGVVRYHLWHSRFMPILWHSRSWERLQDGQFQLQMSSGLYDSGYVALAELAVTMQLIRLRVSWPRKINYSSLFRSKYIVILIPSERKQHNNNKKEFCPYTKIMKMARVKRPKKWASFLGFSEANFWSWYLQKENIKELVLSIV